VLLISLADDIVGLGRVERLARGNLKGRTGSESLSNNHVFNDETTLLSCLFVDLGHRRWALSVCAKQARFAPMMNSHGTGAYM